MGTSSTRAKWRALRSARSSSLKKYLTPPTLSDWPVSVSWRTKLLFQFGIFWRISRARKLHAIAVWISHRHNPQAVSHRWTFPCLDSTRLELAIERQRVFAQIGRA